MPSPLHAPAQFLVFAAVHKHKDVRLAEDGGAPRAKNSHMTDQKRPILNSLGRENTPPPGEPVIVITDKSGCLGYIDFDGGWHRESDGTQIKHVTGWSPME